MVLQAMRKILHNMAVDQVHVDTEIVIKLVDSCDQIAVVSSCAVDKRVGHELLLQVDETVAFWTLFWSINRGFSCADVGFWKIKE
jgi:hypothetical protein